MDYKTAVAEIQQLLSPIKADFVHESYTPMADVFRDTLQELGAKRPAIDIPGWDKFNYFTRGLRMNEFTILCGPTGSGKTEVLSNLAVQLVMQQVPIFVASVETGSNDFMRRMMSTITGKDLRGRAFTQDEREQISQACAPFFKNRNSVFSNYDSRVPHLKLIADTYHAHREKGCKVALFDNFNFFTDVGDGRDQIAKMDKAIHDFITFAKKAPMHSIMVFHPRKTDGGRVESEFDVKGSSTAVQEAQNVILWNRCRQNETLPEKDGEGNHVEPKYCREIKFAKVRENGRATGSRVIYHLVGQGGRLAEVTYK